MAEFTMQVAGQAASVRSLFESTKDYFDAYPARKPPDFSVVTTRQDIEFEQEDLLAQALREGFRPRKFPDPFLERASVQRKFAQHLFQHDTLLFHGSAVAVDGQCYLFTAKSGTGKSTHTRLWREVFGARAVMVNDDKPFLHITREAVWAYGSPWSGKHGLDSNICVLLKGLCILERGKENRIERIDAAQALPMLLHESYQPPQPENREKFQQLVETLAKITPLWRMECNKDPQAAMVSFEAMRQK